jgi:hypothetical protein
MEGNKNEKYYRKQNKIKRTQTIYINRSLNTKLLITKGLLLSHSTSANSLTFQGD